MSAPEVAVISFTGSTTAGRRGRRAAAGHLKRAHLELGGNSALIVLPGADLAKAACAGAFGSFVHQGQICMTDRPPPGPPVAARRLRRAAGGEGVHLPVGDPATREVALGPIIDDGQRDRIHDLVNRTASPPERRWPPVASYEDLFYRPTVLSAVTPQMPAYAEEVFGPVAPVILVRLGRRSGQAGRGFASTDCRWASSATSARP